MTSFDDKDLSQLQRFLGVSAAYIRKCFRFETIAFLIKFLKEPAKVGAIAPSSRSLALAMVEPLAALSGKRNILEIGPGTGAITEFICERIGEEDQLDLLELDPEFAENLTEKYRNKENVRVFQGSLFEWNSDKRYDLLISSLPLNALNAEMVEKVFASYRELCGKGGILCYYEYLMLPGLRSLLETGERRKEYQRTLSELSKFIETHETESKKIWSNIPPAIVHYCRFEER